MPLSDEFRKQTLLAELTILRQALNEQGGGAVTLPLPSIEEAEQMTLVELETMKRELRDLARTLGGVKG